MSKNFYNGQRVVVQGTRDPKPLKAIIKGRLGVSTWIVEWTTQSDDGWDCSEVYEYIIEEDPDYSNILDRYEV